MTYKSLVFACSVLWMLNACTSKKELVYSPHDDTFEEELLDTLVISDVINAMDTLPKPYKSSATLKYDILHTKLDLKFDWKNQLVLGKADITITPYFRNITEIALDAVGFLIHDVRLAAAANTLPYQYDGQTLKIDLGRTLTKQDTIILQIGYTAQPNLNATSGSEAITSDKGLFFIDPLDEDPEVPNQIWTQGETENNKRWFPTFDQPNERFSQEIILTVADKYQTLSNGKIISSVKNPDGTRTDHWKQERPHAPYLAMIAIGEFYEEKEMWNDIPLHYLVEKKYGPHARKIFNHTPEMLSFFSGKLQFPYPWDKYGQVIVRDFVSGAMENTGAVVFGDFIQKTDQELIDNDNDYIVAHEMMHHWFGDLVTCEDWSNLTLNEGFANYAEYLWFEYKYGKDKAEFHRMNEMNGYYGQVFSGSAHSLIDYHYEDENQMFDAHSYNKGGLVLHMLRDYVGDEAFFASLNKYLVDNQNTAVEVDELRMAFEDTIGEDLHWFFDQWFLGVGHPHLDVKYTYNEDNKVLLIEVSQDETPKGFHSVFKIPTDIAIYYEDGSVTYHPVVLEEKNQRFLIEDLKATPSTFVFDGRNMILGLINENKSIEQYKAQFRLSPNFMDKIIAFSSTNDGNADLIDKALKDPFYLFRSMAINNMSDEKATSIIAELQSMVLNDRHSEVRREAYMKLLNLEGFDPTTINRLVLKTERAYPVIQLALEVAGSIEPEKTEEIISKWLNEDSDFLAGTLAGLMKDASESNLNYLESKVKSIKLDHLFDYITSYNGFLADKDLPVLERSAIFLKDIASTKDGNLYRKYASMSSLINIAQIIKSRNDSAPTEEGKILFDSVSSMIADIVKNETNHTLIERYQGIK